MKEEVQIFKLEDLIKSVKTYNKNILDLKRIKEAYIFADKLHEGQMRESGDTYISHPLNVSYILSELHADTDTIIAGLLHDTVEDTEVTLKDVEEKFGNDVAHLVDGVTKIKHIRVENDLNKSSDNDKLALNIEKILNSMNEDVRVMIIKLADRLHNMRTLEFKKNEEKRLRKCRETLYFFAPIANNLGLYDMKSELEDLAFKFMHPKEYKKVIKLIDKLYENEKSILEEMKENLEKKLKKEKIISNEKINICVKHPYRVYRKLNKGRDIEDITNLFSFEVIVKTKKDCYSALSTIHEEYQYIGRKFRDYISVKKTNNYQCLHTAVFTNKDRKLQIKIQTKDMQNTNRYGIADRWENNKESKNTMQKNYLDTEFCKSIKKLLTSYKTSEDLIDGINILFKPGIYIVVEQKFYRVPPYAKVGDLPRLIPPIFDGAKKIKVDGKVVPLNTPLTSRQSIKPIFD